MHAFLKVDLFKLRHIYSCVKCLKIHENSGQMFSSSAHLHRKAMGKQCSKNFSLWIAKHYTGYMMQYLIWIHTDSISSTICVLTNRWAFRCTCASIKKNPSSIAIDATGAMVPNWNHNVQTLLPLLSTCLYILCTRNLEGRNKYLQDRKSVV